MLGDPLGIPLCSILQLKRESARIARDAQRASSHVPARAVLLHIRMYLYICDLMILRNSNMYTMWQFVGRTRAEENL